MKSDKIVVIGCAGSGKSTLAKELSSKINIPVFHMDRMWWRENWTHITTEELQAALKEVIENPCWILDGNYDATLPMRLEKCNTVVYLDFPRLLCIKSAIWRVFQNFGRSRPDMHEGCPEKVDLEFLAWIWNFNKTHRAKYYTMLNHMPHKQVYIAKNRKELPYIIAEIVKQQG